MHYMHKLFIGGLIQRFDASTKADQILYCEFEIHRQGIQRQPLNGFSREMSNDFARIGICI
ncbi:hypothetical protein D3C87_2075990 [compost metagenome]